jgi:5-oxoprolinase (ATP-hydrolysing)
LIHQYFIDRLTDPEILERRYPVILNKFCLAEGSGGQGKFRGGEGVLRQVFCFVSKRIQVYKTMPVRIWTL